MLDVEQLDGSLSAEDRRRLAELHATSIDQGFLSSLGPALLESLYDTFATSDVTQLYVGRDDRQQIVALAVTTDRLMAVYLRFARRHGLTVLPRLLPRLMSRRAVGSVLETATYPLRERRGRPPERTRERELINLCVDETQRGRGWARLLMQQVVSDFATSGGGVLKIVTGGHQTAAHSLYQSLGARRVAEVEVHRGVPSLVFELEVAAS